MKKNIDPLVPLKDLFTVRNGVSSSMVRRISYRRNKNCIPFIRPSHRQTSCIDAYVNRHTVKSKNIYPAETLYVSTDGQGSHSYAYVSTEPFVPNSNVCVLIPKRPMDLREKIFYALCITHNRFKFSYGRKPKGERLKNILLPATLPDDIKEINISPASILNMPDSVTLSEKAIDTGSESLVCLDKLFAIHNGIASDKVIRSCTRKNENWIPYIRPSYRQDSSIDAYVNRHFIKSSNIFPVNTLYVSTDGQGSHSYAYVSTEPFVPNSNVCVLIPRKPMTLREKLFYALCITHNRFKFSYGRKPKGIRLKQILLPAAIPERINELQTDGLVMNLTELHNPADFEN